MQLTDTGKTEQFIASPNLPINSVTLCAVGERYASVIAELNRIGINVLALEQAPELPLIIRSHADMLILHTAGQSIIVENRLTKVINTLSEHGFTVTKTDSVFGSKYPDDVLLNSAICGEYVIGRSCSQDTSLNIFISENRLIQLNVKQGYAKCSTVIVDKKAIISDDDTICKIAVRNSFDVLKAEKGDIQLSGASYGFIGGCCGKISKDIMVFTGNLKHHRNCDDIKSFLRNYNVYPEYLSNNKLTDIGGILPLMERPIKQI